MALLRSRQGASVASHDVGWTIAEESPAILCIQGSHNRGVGLSVLSIFMRVLGMFSCHVGNVLADRGVRKAVNATMVSKRSIKRSLLFADGHTNVYQVRRAVHPRVGVRGKSHIDVSAMAADRLAPQEPMILSRPVDKTSPLVRSP